MRERRRRSRPGCSVAASRVGLSVLMVEKYGFCGGATVAGLSGAICSLFQQGQSSRTDSLWFRRRVLQRMARLGGVGKPPAFGKTMLVAHESVVCKGTADCLLQQQQMRILYNTHFLRAFRQENRINALLVQAKEVRPSFSRRW
jgi:hypothetical protein